MDILVTSTGKIWRRIDDGVGHMLIDALPSIFERVKNPAAVSAPAPTGPRFWVAPSASTGNLGIHVQLPSSETRSVYSAVSKAAAESALGAGAMPQAVWDAFAAKTNAGKDPDWLADQAALQVVKNRW